MGSIMRSRFLASAVAADTFVSAANADEGMWRSSQTPRLAAQLKARGLKMDPAALYNLAGKPLDALISAGGCTASVASTVPCPKHDS